VWPLSARNRKLAQYVETSKAHGRMTAVEFLFKDLALQLLAFAFGLGIGRRTIDLYLTLPERIKKPVQRLEYLINRGWIGARRFARRSIRRIIAGR
jgi:hypothetical protein